jgi:hypothetical protein
VTHPRRLLLDASDVIDLFLTATLNDDFLPLADSGLSDLCEREGADNAAAAMAALCQLTLLTWAEARGIPTRELLDRVRRRIDDDPPPTLARV